MWPWLALLAFALIAWLLLSRSGELFCVSVRGGRALVVRGRIPQALLNDLADALANEPGAVTIRAHRDASGARLQASGVDEFTEQRLRNIFRLYPVSNLSAAPAPARRSLGQVLGIAWLAWFFDRSRG